MQINTHEIQIGDLINSYGVTFRITKLNTRTKDDKYGHLYGDILNFATEVVKDESNGAFPKSWQKDYSIQGNKRATWRKV